MQNTISSSLSGLSRVQTRWDLGFGRSDGFKGGPARVLALYVAWLWLVGIGGALEWRFVDSAIGQTRDSGEWGVKQDAWQPSIQGAAVPGSVPPPLLDRHHDLDLVRRQLVLRHQRLKEHWAELIAQEPPTDRQAVEWLEFVTRGEEYLRRAEHLQVQLQELRNEIDYYQQLAKAQLPAVDEGLSQYSSVVAQRTAAQVAELAAHLQRMREARNAWQQQFDEESKQAESIPATFNAVSVNEQIELLKRRVFAPDRINGMGAARETLEMLRLWQNETETTWQLMTDVLVGAKQQRFLSAQAAMPRQIDWLNQSIQCWERFERQGEIAKAQRVEPDSVNAAAPTSTVEVAVTPSHSGGTAVTTQPVARANDLKDNFLEAVDLRGTAAVDPATPVASERHVRIENRINQLRLEQLQISGQIATIRNKLEVLKQKIESTGLNASNTALLLDTRRNLPLRQENRQKIQQLLEENRLETLEDLNLIDQRDAMRTRVALAESQGELVQAEQLKLELSALERWSESHKRYLELLSLAATEREALDRSLESIEEYLNYQLLWVRETVPFGTGQTSKAWEGLGRVFHLSDWLDLVWGTLQRARHRPHEPMLALIGLAALAYVTRWLKN